MNLWWKISNSKQNHKTNFRTGDTAIEGGNKPLFLRKLVVNLKMASFTRSLFSEIYFSDRLQISLLILSEFKRINFYLLINQWFSGDFREI